MRIKDFSSRMSRLENLSKFSSSQAKLIFLDGSTRTISWKDRDHLGILIAAMNRMNEIGEPYPESQFDPFLDLLSYAATFDTGFHRDNLLHTIWGIVIQARHFRDCKLTDYYDLEHCGPDCIWKRVQGEENGQTAEHPH